MSKEWSPYADIVIKNAKIYTVDLTVDEIRSGKTDFTVIENGFAAAKDGRTVAVGAGHGERLTGAGTAVIDAGGKCLLPGFIDSHMHAMFAGTELIGVNFKSCRNKDEFISALSARARATAQGAWIKGCEWNELVWDVKEAPTKRDLDAAAPDNPVMCCRLCHHVYAVNSK
ncbi:MAG: amidohydrolase family protein, partial [Oscillospiraceae bacterium]|nr:amidohydrolase family protein [Oscillospiraceae bacterium]